MTKSEKQIVLDYIINRKNIEVTNVFNVVEILTHLNGNDIIASIISSRDIIRPIVTGEIPPFSEEKDIYNVLRILIDSGLEDMTHEQVGAYLCPVDAKFEARRKYGETHYKFAWQLGLTTKGYPLSATEIGIAYLRMNSNRERQSLMSRLIFSIPFVQHAILKAKDGPFYMPDYLGEFLSPSTVIRRRSNMHKIMSWAYEITEGEFKQLFDNIVWY